MKNYRKKPVVIQATQLINNNIRSLDSIPLSIVGTWSVGTDKKGFYVGIPTLEGTMKARNNDFIIRGVNGEYYPCKPEIFNKTYEKVMETLLSFGEAIEALKNGKRVARLGWNGRGLFVFMQVPADIDVETVVPKMQSLPQSVKDEFARRKKLWAKDWDVSKEDTETIKYRNQLAMVYPDNTIYGWVASPSDILSDDWVIVD
jgi:hypothetical protein